jgi:micrococcal nuclease
MRVMMPLFLLFALLLAGCTGAAGREQPAPTRPTAAEPVAAPPADNYPPLPEGLPQALVVRVVDGDTLVVDLDGREERVRLIGINTPESVDPRRPVQCFGKEASVAAKALLDGQTVGLEDDTTQGSRDTNGRLLRYVWLRDGRMANLEQLTRGFAAEYTFDTPYRYRDVFRAAQRQARDAGVGLWSPATCDGRFDPVGESAPAPAPSQGAPAAAASCPFAPEPGAAPNTPVRIVDLDKAGETVRLSNVGRDAVSLDGWLVCSVRGGESQAGVGGTLAPGANVVLVNPGEPIWSNGQRDDVALYDASGRLISYWEDR